MTIYLIGALRNPQVPIIAEQLRAAGHEVFDDWYGPGPRADEHWKDYEQGRGHTYAQALQGYAATHIFEFDKHHLERADVVVLLLPAGRSGHLELGWAIGRGKLGYILLDDTDRWDIMYQFANGVFYSVDELINALAVLPSEEAKWVKASNDYLTGVFGGINRSINDHY